MHWDFARAISYKDPVVKCYTAFKRIRLSLARLQQCRHLFIPLSLLQCGNEKFISWFINNHCNEASPFSSPSGDLGIGFAWDIHPIHPIQHIGMSVEIFFQLNKILRGSQMFSGCFQMFSGCSQVFTDILLTFAIWSQDVSGCCQEVVKMFSHVLRCSRTFADVLIMFSERCSQDVLRMFSRCSQDVLRMYSRCSQDVLVIYYWYSCVCMGPRGYGWIEWR